MLSSLNEWSQLWLFRACSRDMADGLHLQLGVLQVGCSLFWQEDWAAILGVWCLLLESSRAFPWHLCRGWGDHTVGVLHTPFMWIVDEPSSSHFQVTGPCALSRLSSLLLLWEVGLRGRFRGASLCGLHGVS